jgi:nucleotide-binding universal stress UspA family protein
MKIEKILAGIDFGRDSESVLAYATYFAKIFGSTVNLLYVIDYLTTPPAYLTPYIDEEKKIAEKKFEELKKQLSDSGINSKTEIIVGRLQESFEAATKKKHADMLVLSFMSHALRRSSSEKLIKSLQLPMLVVRGEKSETSKNSAIQIRKILCPTDFSDMSGKALKVARELKEIFSSKLDVIHVSPDYEIAKIMPLEHKEEAIQEVHERAKNKLDEFLHNHAIQEKGIIYEGEPERKIVAFSGENDIDLIVIAPRGLGLIKGMLIGSVTDAILKTSPCPVLVVH